MAMFGYWEGVSEFCPSLSFKIFVCKRCRMETLEGLSFSSAIYSIANPLQASASFASSPALSSMPALPSSITARRCRQRPASNQGQRARYSSGEATGTVQIHGDRSLAGGTR